MTKILISIAILMSISACASMKSAQPGPYMISEFKRRKGSEMKYEALTVEDQRVLAHDRNFLKTVADMYFSDRHPKGTATDLELLQQVLDKGPWSEQNPTDEVIAIGTSFGDILASELDLAWVKYSDEDGTVLALRYKNTSITLFPRDMIIKRLEKDEDTDLSYLYEQLCVFVRKQIADGDYR